MIHRPVPNSGIPAWVPSPMMHWPGPNIIGQSVQHVANRYHVASNSRPQFPNQPSHRNETPCVDERHEKIPIPATPSKSETVKPVNESIETISKTPALDPSQIITEKIVNKSIEVVATKEDANNHSKLIATQDATEVSRLALKCSIDLGLIMDFEADEIAFGRLPLSDFEKMFAVGTNMRVYVSQIYSPFKFWFQTADDGEKLEDMMTQLG